MAYPFTWGISNEGKSNVPLFGNISAGPLASIAGPNAPGFDWNLGGDQTNVLYRGTQDTGKQANFTLSQAFAVRHEKRSAEEWFATKGQLMFTHSTERTWGHEPGIYDAFTWSQINRHLKSRDGRIRYGSKPFANTRNKDGVADHWRLHFVMASDTPAWKNEIASMDDSQYQMVTGHVKGRVRTPNVWITNGHIPVQGSELYIYYARFKYEDPAIALRNDDHYTFNFSDRHVDDMFGWDPHSTDDNTATAPLRNVRSKPNADYYWQILPWSTPGIPIPPQLYHNVHGVGVPRLVGVVGEEYEREDVLSRRTQAEAAIQPKIDDPAGAYVDQLKTLGEVAFHLYARS